MQRGGGWVDPTKQERRVWHGVLGVNSPLEKMRGMGEGLGGAFFSKGRIGECAFSEMENW